MGMSDIASPVPLVFLHGIAGSGAIWAGQLAAFAAPQFRPLAPDLPGYGSRPPVTALSFDAMAEDLEAFLDQAGACGAVLVGHSMGGMLAQTALRRRPDAYRAAVLCATSPAFGNPAGDFQRQFVADRLAPFAAGATMAELAPGMLDGMVGAQLPPGPRDFALSVLRQTPEASFRAAVHCLVQFDERANLAAIRVPVLCLAGGQDRNAPAPMMQKMAGRIPGARYLCLEECGHLPNIEAAEAFNAALRDFLNILPEH